MPGFTDDETICEVWVGYARNTVLRDHPMGRIIDTLVDYVKAVAILLTPFHLGFKGIRLGPSMPAFLTPNVQNVLVENFNIQPISTPEKDIAACLGG